MINRINNYNYISFDIYDTLIFRNCKNPSDIFSMVEKKYNKEFKNIHNFKTNRINCEIKARNIFGETEITLDSIYDLLKDYYQPIVCKRLKQIEIETELIFSCANKFMVRILDYARKKKKRIIITSDMYLPLNVIKNILDRNNIYYDYIYLSSNIGYTKASGKLYSYILKDLKIKPSQIFHIGDNFKSDFINPKRYHISSYYYKRSYKMKKNSNSMIDIFLDNNLDSKNELSYILGYKCFGPILLGFSKWLYNNTQISKSRKLFFLSRDGYLLKNAFNIMFPSVNTEYMYASRRSIIVPSLYKYKTLNEILKSFFIGKSISYKDLFKKFGLDDKEVFQYVHDNNINPKEEVLLSKIQDNDIIKNFFKLNKKMIMNKSITESKNLNNYLNDIGFDEKSIIIDIGWFGNMQKALCKLLNCNTIHGYYVGVNPNSTNYNNLLMDGYLFNPNNPKLYQPINSANGLFELFFLNHHGSVKCFDGSDNIVQFNEYEYKDETFSNIIFSFQNGAIDFINRVVTTGMLEYFDNSEDEYANNIELLINSPDVKIVKLFGDIPFFDEEIYYVAKPNKISYYLLHPSHLKNDFRKAIWRRGFLIRLFNSKIIGNILYDILILVLKGKK